MKPAAPNPNAEGPEGPIDVGSVRLVFGGRGERWVELPQGDVEAPEVGEVLENVVGAFRGEELSFSRLRVVGLLEDGVLRLEPADDASFAEHWRGLNLVGRRKVSTGEGNVGSGVDAIPARGQQTEGARRERLEFIRAETGAELGHLEETPLIARRLSGNIENFLGSVAVPVGLAGPLLFRGKEVEGVAYAPMATSEGTLVASACRGARALTRSGGVVTRVLAQRMLRAPLFVLESLEGALLFAQWIRDHEWRLQEVIGEVSRHARLIQARPLLMGRHVHVQFLYETGDAAGQNMTTTCTWHACQWILAQMARFDEVVFENFVVEANLSSDKKVTFGSFLGGRGTRVVAEALLTREAIEEVLKVSPCQLMKTFQGFMAGSMQAGMVGFNINVANVVAAIFTATGQDIACVHESSLGQFFLEPRGDDVVASLLLPGLIIGTVGGGTQLPQQRDYLELMGCAGAGKSARLAEIIAGYCLALDLSTLSAIASGQFAQAHERLGRNRPVEWLQREDLTPEFFQELLREEDASVMVEEVVHRSDAELGSSIITELTGQKVRKLVGHFPVELRGATAEGPATWDAIAKVKPLDEEVLLMLNAMASMCGPALAASFARYKGALEFTGSDQREVLLYGLEDDRFRRHVPRVYGRVLEAEREIFMLVLEYLRDVELKDTADHLKGWTENHIKAAIGGIAEIHSIYYDRETALRSEPWSKPWMTPSKMVEMTPLWRSLVDHARGEFPGWYSEEERCEVLGIIDDLPRWWGEYDEQPKTLIHNDFNPRNLCFRKTPAGPLLCLYDWELATVAPPQRDLAELLAFVLSDEASGEEVAGYVEFHRVALEEAVGVTIDSASWRRGYRLSLLDLTVNRFGLYLMAHTFRHYGFLERSLATLRRLRHLEEV